MSFQGIFIATYGASAENKLKDGKKVITDDILGQVFGYCSLFLIS
jgi:hypothetical protein